MGMGRMGMVGAGVGVGVGVPRVTGRYSRHS